MTGYRYLIYTCILLSLSHHALAYIEIDPPVAEPVISNDRIKSSFDITNTTTLDSDVVWRGKSLTNQRPGWTSYNSASWKHGFFKSIASYNLLSSASDTEVTQGPAIAGSPAGTTAQTIYLMTEAKIGSAISIGKSAAHKTTIEVYRVIYNWPSGENWLWTGSECDSTNLNLLNPLSSIKPVKSTEITVRWKDFYILYAKSDDGDQSKYSGQTQGASTVNYQAIYGKNWGDYFHIQTPMQAFRPGYTINFEAGYWENIGRYYQGNLNYKFNPTLTGILKVFDFNGFSGNDSNTGASGILKFNYHATLKN